jgi:imidazolonepropionase-like amidohydrolase
MTRDQADYEIDYIARLARAGVPLAIQTGRGLSRHHLIEEARLALRFGLTPRDAIRAVTLVPARILGLADRLGTLAPGKEADLVIWNGHPLSQTSRPLCVILAGQVKHGALPRQEGSL